MTLTDLKVIDPALVSVTWGKLDTWADWMAEENLTREEYDQVKALILSHRGRWMVVDQYGYAVRFYSLSRARGYARWNVHVGVAAVVRRWRRDLVRYIPEVGFVFLWNGLLG